MNVSRTWDTAQRLSAWALFRSNRFSLAKVHVVPCCRGQRFLQPQTDVRSCLGSVMDKSPPRARPIKSTVIFKPVHFVLAGDQRRP